MVHVTMEKTVSDVMEQLAYQHTVPFGLSVGGALSVSGAMTTVGAVSGDNIKTAKVSITNAQIKALAATQVELVAAPGANKLLEFVGAMLRVIAGTEVLAEDGGGSNLGIKYTNDAGVQVSEAIEVTGWIDQLTNAITTAVPIKDAIVADEAGCVNQALVLDNIGAGEIVGNASADATMEIFITYRVHDLS